MPTGKQPLKACPSRLLGTETVAHPLPFLEEGEAAQGGVAAAPVEVEGDGEGEAEAEGGRHLANAMLYTCACDGRTWNRVNNKACSFPTKCSCTPGARKYTANPCV